MGSGASAFRSGFQTATRREADGGHRSTQNATCLLRPLAVVSDLPIERLTRASGVRVERARR